MDEALVRNIKGGLPKQPELKMAQDFADFLRFTKQPLEDFELIAPDDHGAVHFRPEHAVEGNQMTISAHFRRAHGTATPEQKLFGRDEKKKTLEEALRAGQPVLISLNMPLAPPKIDFKNVKAAGIVPAHDWLKAHAKNYFRVSIRNITDLIKLIQKMRETPHIAPVKSSVFVLYRGAVAEFNSFFLGARKPALRDKFLRMKFGDAGVASDDFHRMGFPALIEFVPTKKDLKEHWRKDIKGNRIDAGTGEAQVTQLIFAQEHVQSTEPYKKLSAYIREELKHMYVLTCPVISTNPSSEEGAVNNEEERAPAQRELIPALVPPDKTAWGMLRLPVYNISTQTCPQGVTLKPPKAEKKPAADADHGPHLAAG